MTTTAADQFTVAANAGSGNSWTDKANLLDGASGEAYAEYDILGGTTTKELQLSIPAYISAIDDGSQFVSLKVTLQAKRVGTSSLSGYLASSSQTGSSKSISLGTSYSTTTLDGDKSYWGITGTVYSIFDQLKSGAMYFCVDGTTADTVYVKDVFATLTYTLPDTKRASLMTVAL